MISLIGITIDHRFTQGDPLADIIIDALQSPSGLEGPESPEGLDGGLQSGDIVVVTSKVVAKVEGRVIQAQDREDAITSETVRVVATKVQDRGITRIVETEHGLILAAAGVDASNTEDGTVVLLPQDPDASARTLREEFAQKLNVNVGVIVTDTLGRAWRLGVTDHAIGAAGIQVLDDLTGSTDAFGQQLHMTVIAIADELAAASELVRAKASMTPVAVIRGASKWVTDSQDSSDGAKDLIRPASEDLFSVGTHEARIEGARSAVFNRRTVRNFLDEPVPQVVIANALRAGASAPAPHHTQPWRFLVLEKDKQGEQGKQSEQGKKRTLLLDAMRVKWIEDLRAEGKSDDEITRRVARGNVLRTAPTVIFPFIDLASGAHTYPEPAGRNLSELHMFLIAGGAAVENILISIANQGFGSAWISSSIFCPHTMREHLQLPDSYWPLGGIAVGRPAASAPAREEVDIEKLLI